MDWARRLSQNYWYIILNINKFFKFKNVLLKSSVSDGLKFDIVQSPALTELIYITSVH